VKKIPLKKIKIRRLQMQLGMIGLGRMGANMVRRLLRKGHECVVVDTSPTAAYDLVEEKAIGSTSLAAIVGRLKSPRGEADFANKLLSAMRYQFGGHLEKAGQKPRVA
jgi:6-phosphogluconate dehydrogenase (decarboxylating)